MDGLDRFVAWLGRYVFVDRNHRLLPGLTVQYHPRSNALSKYLGEQIIEDLLDTCPVLCEQAERGEIVFATEYRFEWPNGKHKTLDIATGIPSVKCGPPIGARIHRLGRV